MSDKTVGMIRKWYNSDIPDAFLNIWFYLYMNDYWFTENTSESTVTISDDDLEKVRTKLKMEREKEEIGRGKPKSRPRPRPRPKKKNISGRKCLWITIAITALMVLGIIAIL